MEEITLNEALNPFCTRGLEQLRLENNIVVPEEYINSTKNLCLAGMIFATICGVFIGLGVSQVLENLF